MADTESELIDKFVRHIVYLERYKKGQAKELERVIRRTYREVNGLLQGSSLSTKARLNRVLKQIDEILSVMKEDVGKFFDDEIKNLSETEIEFTKRALGASTDTRLSYTAIAFDQLTSSVYSNVFEGRTLRQHIDKFTRSQRKLINSKIRAGFVSGSSIQEVSSNLRQSLNLSRRQSEALVRTGMNHISNIAKNEFYRANDDIVETQKYLAVLDGRTTDTCRARDGKEFPLDRSPVLPAHWGCRSIYIPVLKKEFLNDSAAIGTRESASARPGGSKKTDVIGKPVKADLTQDEYLRRQPKWFLEDVLGKQKAELFRKGGLGVEDFVNNVRQARPLTLKELRSKFPSAFEKARLN